MSSSNKTPLDLAAESIRPVLASTLSKYELLVKTMGLGVNVWRGYNIYIGVISHFPGPFKLVLCFPKYDVTGELGVEPRIGAHQVLIAFAAEQVRTSQQVWEFANATIRQYDESFQRRFGAGSHFDGYLGPEKPRNRYIGWIVNYPEEPLQNFLLNVFGYFESRGAFESARK